MRYLISFSFLFLMSISSSAFATRIFVGSIPKNTVEVQVAILFAQFGTVNEVSFIYNRDTKEFRGFGFVDMPNQSEAHEAIKALDGFDWEEALDLAAADRTGYKLRVDEARPRDEARVRGSDRTSITFYPGGYGGGRRNSR